MFAILGSAVFSTAAIFSIAVIVQMVRGYMPQIEKALRNDPMRNPNPTPPAPFKAYAIRRRQPVRALAANRPEAVRVAA